MPVRDSIQPSPTPIRAAIGALVTTCSGSAVPIAATAAPRRLVRGARSALVVTVSDMRGLRGGNGLDVLERAFHETGQHLAGADLDEAADALAGQRVQHVGEAHRV